MGECDGGLGGCDERCVGVKESVDGIRGGCESGHGECGCAWKRIPCSSGEMTTFFFYYDHSWYLPVCHYNELFHSHEFMLATLL